MNAPSAAVPGVNVVNNSTDQTQYLMGHTLLPFEASTLSSQFGQDLEFLKITGRVPIFNGLFQIATLASSSGLTTGQVSALRHILSTTERLNRTDLVVMC